MPTILQKKTAENFLVGGLLLIIGAVFCGMFWENIEVMWVILLLPIAIWSIGIGIVWNCRKGNIVGKRMRCIKAYKISPKNMAIIMTDLDTEEEEPHKFIMSGMKNAADVFTSGSAYTIYYNVSNDANIIAWEYLAEN